MILKLVKFIDYDANYAYSPPERDATIDMSQVVSITPIERGATRRPFDDLVRIRFRDGSWMDVLGKPSDFVADPENIKMASIIAFCYNGLRCDGAHHKQWFLEEILKLVVSPQEYERVKDEWKAGIAP